MRKFNYFFIISTLLFISCKQEKYIEFKPYDYLNDNLIVKEEYLTPGFYHDLEIVLTFYQEDFIKNEKGVILVSKKLSNDIELCYNYTLKAKEW